jgi:hypothetical protein
MGLKFLLWKMWKRRVVSGVKELSGIAIMHGRKPRKLSSHDDLPLFVSRIRFPGTQGTHTTHSTWSCLSYTSCDRPLTLRKYSSIFEDTSVDMKVYKRTKLVECSRIRFRRHTVFYLWVRQWKFCKSASSLYWENFLRLFKFIFTITTDHQTWNICISLYRSSKVSG